MNTFSSLAIVLTLFPLRSAFLTLSCTSGSSSRNFFTERSSAMSRVRCVVVCCDCQVHTNSTCPSGCRVPVQFMEVRVFAIFPASCEKKMHMRSHTSHMQKCKIEMHQTPSPVLVARRCCMPCIQKPPAMQMPTLPPSGNVYVRRF